MSYPEGILAVGALILTSIGGLAGNIFTVYFIRYRDRQTQNITLSDNILFGIIILLLMIVTGAFLNILTFTNLWMNPTIFFLCIGILFGILGSILANLFGAAFNNHIDSKINCKHWLTADVKSIICYGFSLILIGAYLIWLWSRFL